MKKITTIIFQTFVFILLINTTFQKVQAASCNWKSRSATTSFWDSCNTTKNTYSLNGYIAFSSKSCFKYQWTVNGSNAGTGYFFNFPIKANGKYTICVKVMDTCNNCDTTYCTSRGITCIKSTCNWKSRSATTNYWDSCNTTKNRYSLNAYISFSSKSCFKYQWTVNSASAGKGYVMNFPITQNGSYTICVKVSDTCNNCDTTYCSTRGITCVKSSTCNWKSRNPYFITGDSCNNKSKVYYLSGYTYFNYSKNTCFKYQWFVNSNVVSTSRSLTYNITKNGTYSICMKVTDTCSNCDTTFCYTRTVNCIGSTCNWKSRNAASSYWDSCNTTKGRYSLNAYISFSSKSCFKYQWTVNSASAGTGYVMNFPIKQNGTYTVCVKVSDTCNNCDTTYCSTRTITCIKSPCNWKSKGGYLSAYDTCNTTKNRYNLNGHIYFGSTSCLKYQWTVNGKNAGTSNYLISYPITQNGTYSVCVKITDSCNNCDTTYCSIRTITCIKNTCNWNGQKMGYYFWDSCNSTKNRYSLNAYISFSSKSCLKYQWTVNGNNAGTGYIMNYQIKQNGTYSVCVKVSDTCNSCDTTYCSTRTITCIKNTCNWKNQKPNYYFWDSCNATKKRYSLNAYISFSSKSCLKYQWTVNNASAGTGSVMNYPITKNGTYSVCVKVTDTCNNCDTTYCSTRNITCISSSTCNWKSRNAANGYWDSCNSTKNKYSLNAYISFSAKSCLKYQWTVNGNNAGNGYIMNYPIKQNGTYSICVKVTDTCYKCDTTYCTTRGITCVKGATCNWKSRTPANGYWDSCSGKKNKYSLNAYIYFTNWPYKSCFKYQWTVNGNNVGNGYVLSYPITANGTYSLCVKVTDTCNNCDTTYCTTRTITCVGTSKCNWKSRSPNYYFWDSCSTTKKRYSLNAYISFNPKSCLKYQWTVNGNKAGNGSVMNYPITANGKYSVCVKVTDTCNNCDTTYCTSRGITCISNCNWVTKGMYFSAWDSCNTKTGKYSLNGYIGPSGGCYKYNWYVNSTLVSTSRFFSYSVTKNGTYSLCMKVVDTCNNCDTTFCSTRYITCVKAGCNWKGQKPGYYFWDSCTGKHYTYSLNGYISFSSKSCMKYQWTVNGYKAGNGYIMNFPITQNGKYTVCVKVTDTCHSCDTTYCNTRTITCLTSGIKPTGSDKQLKIYPNPSEGMVYFENNNGHGIYSLTDVSGQIIQNGVIENGQQTLDISKHPAGLYFINIQTSEAIFKQKIILLKH